MCSEVGALIAHTLGPYRCLLNPRKTSAGFYAIMPIQLLLNDNSSILQLKIKGRLTPFPISVLSNKDQTGLLLVSCYAGTCYQQYCFPSCVKILSTYFPYSTNVPEEKLIKLL